MRPRAGGRGACRRQVGPAGPGGAAPGGGPGGLPSAGGSGWTGGCGPGRGAGGPAVGRWVRLDRGVRPRAGGRGACRRQVGPAGPGFHSPRRGAGGRGSGGTYPTGGRGFSGASGRSAPGARLPGGVPISPEKWGERGPGASPLDPGFYGPLAAARSFLGSLSLIRRRGYFVRYPNTDLGRIFRKNMLKKHFMKESLQIRARTWVP